VQPDMRHAPLTRSQDCAGPPRVSIGLPVHNGERYLEEALDSLLAQTYQNFELIISDNASTDRTADICLAYAAREPRIRYSRLETNIGGFRNHNRVVALAQGEYFSWAAHDDIRKPEHLARCVEALDRNPDIVLCFTREQRVNADGAPFAHRHRRLAATTNEDALERWMSVARGGVVVEAVYGVIRKSVLLQTGLHQQTAHADRILLCELLLLGKFWCIEEPLFLKRIHPGASVAQYRSLAEFAHWYEPQGTVSGATPNLSFLRRLAATLYRSRFPLVTRLFGLRALVPWMLVHQYELRQELGLTRTQLLQTAARVFGAGWLRPL
jgi:glycosyltransferase involved in cell wall biosynthesis